MIYGRAYYSCEAHGSFDVVTFTLEPERHAFHLRDRNGYNCGIKSDIIKFEPSDKPGAIRYYSMPDLATAMTCCEMERVNFLTTVDPARDYYYIELIDKEEQMATRGQAAVKTKEEPESLSMATVEGAIAVLNRLVEADAEAMDALLNNRVVCNEAMANDDTAQVGVADPEDESKGYLIGLLGVINDIFGIREDGYGFISAEYGEDDKLAGFMLTPAEVE